MPNCCPVFGVPHNSFSKPQGLRAKDAISFFFFRAPGPVPSLHRALPVDLEELLQLAIRALNVRADQRLGQLQPHFLRDTNQLVPCDWICSSHTLVQFHVDAMQKEEGCGFRSMRPDTRCRTGGARSVCEVRREFFRFNEVQ